MDSKNKEIYSKLCRVIPSGVNSPVRSFKGLGIGPIIASHGAQDTIWDVEGKSYIDYCCSWGALLHGHANEKILRFVKDRIEKGTTFGLSTEIEEKLASEIVSSISSIEKIRFVSSGTEATMSAIRLARGFTGRRSIIKFAGNYHGCNDVEAISLPYNDLEEIDNVLNKDTAAIIVEPIAANMGVVPAKKEFLKLLRDKCTKVGALLIFDEVVSGFRVSSGGAQEIYGIEPDLTCLGKIIGGGFPAAAYGGRADIMDRLAPRGNVYQAGTLSGNPIAMEAGLQALLLTKADNFYDELEQKTNIITKPVQKFIKENKMTISLWQVGSMFSIFLGVPFVSNYEEAGRCDREMFANFFKFMLKKGIYLPPSHHEAWFVSSTHSCENLKKTRDAILEFLKSYV